MKKAFEIYNRDMRSANKQYTQYNIPSAYALMLTHKDTVPRVYYGDMYTDDGQYMAKKSPYYDAIETLLKGRIRYAAGGQDMKVNYIGYGNTNGWDAAGVLTSVRYGTGANSASDAGTAETRNQGMAVIVSNQPALRLTSNYMGAAHRNQAYRPLLLTTNDGVATYLNDSDANGIVKYTDGNGNLTFNANEIRGIRNPQVDGYLAVWVPVGASENQDVRVAPRPLIHKLSTKVSLTSKTSFKIHHNTLIRRLLKMLVSSNHGVLHHSNLHHNTFQVMMVLSLTQSSKMVMPLQTVMTLL